MSLKKIAELGRNQWLTRLAFGLSIVSAIIAMVLYTSIDTIVNVDLYKFGLQFSPEWYDAYSLYTKLFFACLLLSTAISGAVLVLSFLNMWHSSNFKGENNKNLKNPGNTEDKNSSVEKTSKRKVFDTTCPACKRVFSKPVMMLNLVEGKPKMVSTCPYCSEVIATEEQ